MIYGEIGDLLMEKIIGKVKFCEIMSWGVVFESEFQFGGFIIGFNGGAVSGDDLEFLGVFD